MRTGDSDPNPRNHSVLKPFVKFKQHIDSTISAVYETMLRSPDDASPPNSEQQSWRDHTGALIPLLLGPYSPYELRHLPQPVPNDLPEGYDRSLFTFQDAFGDLLIATANEPLPDIRHRYEMNKRIRDMFPRGEPSWFWMERLRGSGLFGPHRTDEERQERLRTKLELDRKSSNVWRPVQPPEVGRTWEEAQEIIEKLSGQVLESVEATTKMLGLGVEESPQKRPEPQSYDDLYLAIRDWAESGQRSWDSFKKIVTEGKTSFEVELARERERLREKERMRERDRRREMDQMGDEEGWNQVQSQSKAPPSEIKIEESRDEHVDKFGYVHSKVTRREVDSKGNELSRTTSYQMYPSREPRKGASEREDAIDNDQFDRGRDRKNGWFWK